MTPDRPPCTLPSWPAPPLLGGLPDDEAETLTLTRDGLDEIARYQARVLEWSEKALLCLR